MEDAQSKLASVASDVLGVSGRSMLRALIGGVKDPAQSAELVQGRLQTKKDRDYDIMAVVPDDAPRVNTVIPQPFRRER